MFAQALPLCKLLLYIAFHVQALHDLVTTQWNFPGTIQMTIKPPRVALEARC